MYIYIVLWCSIRFDRHYKRTHLRTESERTEPELEREYNINVNDSLRTAWSSHMRSTTHHHVYIQYIIYKYTFFSSLVILFPPLPNFLFISFRFHIEYYMRNSRPYLYVWLLLLLLFFGLSFKMHKKHTSMCTTHYTVLHCAILWPVLIQP